MAELGQLLVQNIGAITVTGAFLWYLTKRDKEFSESLKELNRTLAAHAAKDIIIQKEITRNLQKLHESQKKINDKI